MNDYILIGLLIMVGTNYLQIAEEWKDRGLDDTSYKAILLLIGGPAAVAYGLWLQGAHTLMYLFVGLSIAAGILGALKLRDLFHSRLRLLK